MEEFNETHKELLKFLAREEVKQIGWSCLPAYRDICEYIDSLGMSRGKEGKISTRTVTVYLTQFKESELIETKPISKDKILYRLR